MTVRFVHPCVGIIQDVRYTMKKYMKDSHSRSLAKGLSWRFVASLATMTIVYLLTGDLQLVAAAGAVDLVAKFILYYMHERAWACVTWGQPPCPPTSDTADSSASLDRPL